MIISSRYCPTSSRPLLLVRPPTESATMAFPTGSCQWSILPRVAILLDIHFPHLLFHAFTLGGIGIDKVLLLPPKGPSPFLTRQAIYSTVHVGVWALDMDYSGQSSSFRNLQTISYIYLYVQVLIGSAAHQAANLGPSCQSRLLADISTSQSV